MAHGPATAYRTPAGRMFVGRAEQALESPALDPWRGGVQLVFTSPPFPLLRKKKYGNLCGDEYARWLASFAIPLAKMLSPDGSIVLELGNGWNPGTPTVSTAGMSTDELLKALAAAPIVRCDAAQWRLFGVSLAGWNALVSLGGAAAIGVLLGRRR